MTQNSVQMKPYLKILVVLDQQSPVMEGIADYNQQDEWLIRVAENCQDIAQIIQSWQPSGLIYYSSEATIASAKLPRIELFNPFPKKDFYSIDINHESTGILAAEYLINKGYPNPVFITGSMQIARSMRRFESFKKTIEAHGGQTCFFENHCSQGLFPSEDLQKHTTLLGKWLSRHPRPLAVFTVNDNHALHVLEACRQFNLNVPEDVAVLGADNNTHLCAIAHPSLSSIQLPYKQIGFEAARLLDTHLRRKKISARHIQLDPIGIIERRSTEILAIRDEAVVRALNYIREHRIEPIRIPDVVKCSGVSRTLLQQKFQHALNRTPLGEIHRQKIEIATKLLHTTAFTMDEIAEKCGLADQAQFTKLFRKKVGMTPSAFRKKPLLSPGEKLGE
ncbi:MAG: substrate-binding domain-containing protein [Kiritimatiellales bacterium]